MLPKPATASSGCLLPVEELPVLRDKIIARVAIFLASDDSAWLTERLTAAGRSR
jgi:hypothetical protein